jgi:hypothetical protein
MTSYLQDFFTEVVYRNLYFLTRAARFAHLIFLDAIILIKFMKITNYEAFYCKIFAILLPLSAA